jgi:thioredoxin-related protein
MKDIIIGILVGVVFSLVAFIVYSNIVPNGASTNTNQHTLVVDKDLEVYSKFYNPKANPHLDLQKASIKAEKNHKRIFMIVGDTSCPWSSEFDRFISSNQAVNKNLYDNYEVLKVFYNTKTKNKDIQSFLKQFPKGEGTPHFYILDTKKRLLRSQSSTSLEQGFSYSADRVNKVLLQWKEP